MKTVKVGIVGCGVVGKIHAAALQGLEEAKLVAVADVADSNINTMKDLYYCQGYTDYRRMLKEESLDLVAVCVPPLLHQQVAKDAARVGVNVLVEKPLDVDGPACDTIINACHEGGVRLGIVFQHRYDHAVQLVKRELNKGTFGKILIAESKTMWYRDDAYYASADGWRASMENRGGVLMSQAIHYIDLLLYLTGDATSVCGVCESLAHNISVEDTGLALLRFENGALGLIQGTTSAWPGLYAEINLYCEKGTVTIRDDKLSSYKLMTGSLTEFDELIRQNLNGGQAAAARPEDLDLEPHKAVYRDMAAALRDGREPSINGKEGRRAVALIDAIYQAAGQNIWIQL